MAFFGLGVIVPSVFAIAKCQAYLFAGFANLSAFGLAKGSDALGPSGRRKRGARIYGGVVTGGVVLIFCIAEVL